MVTTTHRSKGWNALALLLVLPTFFFIIISALKYEFGVQEPFDSVAPWLEQMGIKESLGFNINLLILFGPLLALGICLFQVLHIGMNVSKEQFLFNVTVRKKWLPLFIIFLSGLVMAVLFIYAVGENCS